ncbi:MAG TPA: FtsH protease activity modulator HflK [Usitatibacteraceae bacterium]|nr:FtsH protease activity modulator HflK [Usitatibacteraceae bacterium]
MWRRARRDDGLSLSNDPNWGKRGQDGPPDLDEILRKFNQKLAGIFGSGPPPKPGDGGGTNMSPNAIGGGFALAIGIAISVWLATGFYIVDQGKKGVELRLGKYTQTTDAGPRWHWPYPIETAEVVDVLQVRSIEVGHRNSQKTKMPDEALMLTEDQNIVDVQFSVQFNLKSPEEYIFNNKDPDEAVRQVAETAMREVVGKSKMDFVLYEGRGDIAARVKTLMQQILDRYKTGVNITGVNMQNAQPPEQVQASFNDAVRAKQDKERLKNEGEAYANDIVPKAKGRASAMLEEANAHKQRVIASAQGDASRFTQLLAEYEKAPGVTRERLYLDTMQQILQGTSKVIVDQKGGNNLLYLPLDKLMAAPAPAVEAPRAAPQPEPVVPPVEARRDLRNR